ncbi:MAG: class I SAM-dependent methyltransferase [bacterium]
MKKYLYKKFDYLQPDITNAYEELPLWSAPFGLLLLDNFPIGEYTNYLDIGCATGFPLIDIAQKLGNKCSCVGIDPWAEAIKRAKMKIDTFQLENISVVDGDASGIPFPNDYFDLITSNLGINNFENPDRVLSECHRVLKTDGSLCLTTNLTGTFTEFYDVFFETINQLGYGKYLAKLNEHVNHRGTEESVIKLIDTNGFKIINKVKSHFQMRFLNGTTFLNHSFILLGFINSWRDMFEETEKQIFFDTFESNLNVLSKNKGELKLTIPMLYLECKTN